MSKPVIFISHIREEAELAGIFKKHLTAKFLGMVDVFDSSDSESVAAGENWLASIDKWLRASCIEIILCSKASINRPWVNFEAGAAWMRKIDMIPVCHSGLQPQSLPMPFCVLQGIEANQETGIDRVFARIAAHLKCAKPSVTLRDVVEEVTLFENKYEASLKYYAGSDFLNDSRADRVTGSWEGTGRDVEVPEYPPLELKSTYNMRLDLRREGGKIRGKLNVDVIERDVTVAMNMVLIGIVGDNYTFNYQVDIPNANHFGIMMFQLIPTGAEMRGYFLTNKGYEMRLAIGVIKFHRKAS